MVTLLSLKLSTQGNSDKLKNTAYCKTLK